jgi:hypothetical protein
MADESQRIHETIVATRQDLEEKLDRLGDELRRRVDVRRRIAERPWLALAGSITVGFAVGRLSGGDGWGEDVPPRSALRPRSLLTHVAFALLSGMVHEVIDRQVPRLVALVSDRDRETRRHAGNGASAPRDAPEARRETAAHPHREDESEAGVYALHP